MIQSLIKMAVFFNCPKIKFDDLCSIQEVLKTSSQNTCSFTVYLLGKRTSDGHLEHLKFIRRP